MEKETTIRTVGNNGFQTTVPKEILKNFDNPKKIKWIKKGKKIIIEVI